MAAALPPLDPPGILARSTGLRVVPKNGLSVVTPPPSSCTSQCSVWQWRHNSSFSSTKKPMMPISAKLRREARLDASSTSETRIRVHVHE